jgi:hypothetical protein
VLVRAFRSCYSGRRPLVLWESLAAGMQAALFLPRRRGGVQPHLALRDVVGSTVSTAALVAVVVAPPIGARQPEHRPALVRLPAVTPNALRPGVPPARAPRTIPRPRSRSARAVVHVTPPADRKPARYGQTRSWARGAARAVAHAPASSVNIGSTAPDKPPPTKPPPTSTRPRPPAAPPGTTGRSPPTTPTATRPVPVAPPAAPGTTTTTASGPPIVAPTPTPTGSASAPPMTKDQCKKDGYSNYGFPNQGQCVASAEHHG